MSLIQRVYVLFPDTRASPEQNTNSTPKGPVGAAGEDKAVRSENAQDDKAISVYLGKQVRDMEELYNEVFS